MNPWGNPWQPGWYQQPYPNVYVPPQQQAPASYWGDAGWNSEAAYQHGQSLLFSPILNIRPHTVLANRFQSRKYPNLNPILAADQTLLRYDIRNKPKETIQASTYYQNCQVAALAKSNVTHMRLISKAFPWTIDVKGSVITCEIIWDAIYCALQEPLADSEWGMVVGDKEKDRREAIVKAAGKRELKDGDKRLKRIDWLGDATLFKGLEKDDDFEKLRLLPKGQPCGETWLLKLSAGL